MGEKQKWELSYTIYLIQIILFYITFVAGIVLLVLVIVKKISFSIIGALLIYAFIVIIQFGFMVLLSDTDSEEPQLKNPKPKTKNHQSSSLDEET